jgi:EmrB/QacA subfamily drug resistance transporter
MRAAEVRHAEESAVARASSAGLILAVLAVTQFLMALDTSVMNVSISALVDDLDTSVTAIQGVITAYTLVMAAFMIAGGKIGDILGRRRTLRIGLVIYACGSLITSLSPNVGVLLSGWSVLEGLGAVLIMPTVTVLIAGNFTGQRRAVAYGTIAAASAVAVAVGPIVGGFVTANFSWRWVFFAEVFIALGIFVASRVITDVPPDERPSLDVVGAFLSAAGLAMFVLGVLQSGTWGWITPKVPDGPDATPELLGFSPVTWLVLGGLFLLWCFVSWQHRVERRGGTPLVSPVLFANTQLTNGLTVLLLQYLIMMGMFFTMPLFLSIVLGLDAFETGLRMVPLSLALVVVAMALPRVRPQAIPRRVVLVGLLLMLAATLLLAVRLEDGATAAITTLPFLLMGAGMGAMASQLGNVIVSAVPVRSGGEAGGLQYTAQNLGSSLGTALIGAVVLGSLGTLFMRGIEGSSALDAELKKQAQVEISAGVNFVSDAQLEEALSRSGLSAAEQQVVIDANADARLGALRRAMVVVAFFVLVALFFGRRLPGAPLGSDGQRTGETDVTPTG